MATFGSRVSDRWRLSYRDGDDPELCRGRGVAYGDILINLFASWAGEIGEDTGFAEILMRT